MSSLSGSLLSLTPSVLPHLPLSIHPWFPLLSQRTMSPHFLPPTFPSRSPLTPPSPSSPPSPSLQSRNGQVYLWGDAQCGPRRPVYPLLAAPDGPAHGSPGPAGHALRHLPVQLHRPQACALPGSAARLPGAAAWPGGLHCQDGSGQREQEGRAAEVLALLSGWGPGAGAGRTRLPAGTPARGPHHH